MAVALKKCIVCTVADFTLLSFAYHGERSQPGSTKKLCDTALLSEEQPAYRNSSKWAWSLITSGRGIAAGVFYRKTWRRLLLLRYNTVV